LVNEAYLRLVDHRHVRWQNRAHFFGIAAQLMRRILIDHARRRQRLKRGSEAKQVTFDDTRVLRWDSTAELIALDEALTDLSAFDARRARVVELRFFGGLNVDETAEVLKIDARTVVRDWSTARAWLYRRLTSASARRRPDERSPSRG